MFQDIQVLKLLICQVAWCFGRRLPPLRQSDPNELDCLVAHLSEAVMLTDEVQQLIHRARATSSLLHAGQSRSAELHATKLPSRGIGFVLRSLGLAPSVNGQSEALLVVCLRLFHLDEQLGGFFPVHCCFLSPNHSGAELLVGFSQGDVVLPHAAG